MSEDTRTAHQGRVKRAARKKTFSKTTYRNALPLLLEDFQNRCAYSMEHADDCGKGGMHVDHFNPRLKNAATQRLENLMPATYHCNHSKKAVWPTPEEEALGLRFLDPTIEQDYGSQIFEELATGLLVGTTPAAVFHIEFCGLNASYLVRRRLERTNLRVVLERCHFGDARVDEYDPILKQSRDFLERKLATKIPFIPEDASNV